MMPGLTGCVLLTEKWKAELELKKPACFSPTKQNITSKLKGNKFHNLYASKAELEKIHRTPLVL